MHTPLMSARRRKRLKIVRRADATIINLGEMEIWDGADLALVRDTLFELIVEKNHKSVGVDMRWVKYVPSGFFGMLSDWNDKGIRVVLHSPQPNVREMLWFRQFFVPAEDDCHLLLGEPVSDLLGDEPDEFDELIDDDSAEAMDSVEPTAPRTEATEADVKNVDNSDDDVIPLDVLQPHDHAVSAY